MNPLGAALATLAAYLIGSLSFAVIVSRAMGLSDPRTYGSGNPGATNVLRSGRKGAALAAAGLPFLAELVCCGESAIEPARVATQRLLALNERPTAIMTSNNLMTIGAMQALRDAAIEVPRDMALVAFDDFDWADLFNPRLTVMAQPLEEIGAKALNLLIKRIKNPEGNRQTIRLSPTIHIRNSCGCP